MGKVILDTNFILSCIREKIDFFEDLTFKGFRIQIPKQVIFEIERILNSNKKLKFRNEARIALKLLETNPFRKIDLKTKNVDSGLVKLSKKDPGITIGTLDRELKRKIKNPKIVIRGKKQLEVI